MGPSWWGIASLVINGVLVVLFIVGGFFMIRRYLRKMKQPSPPAERATQNDDTTKPR